MGMGYGADYADVIEEKAIKKFCKKEFEIFMACVEGCKLDFEEFAQNSSYTQFDGYDKDLIKSYTNLYDAFKKKTGLMLELSFHDADSYGDRYDQVSGAYWAVDGMYQLTPAGKKMKKYVERCMFVNFG